MLNHQLPQSTVIGDTEEGPPEDWNLGNLIRGQSLCLECGSPFAVTVENFTLCPTHQAERGR